MNKVITVIMAVGLVVIFLCIWADVDEFYAHGASGFVDESIDRIVSAVTFQYDPPPVPSIDFGEFSSNIDVYADEIKDFFKNFNEDSKFTSLFKSVASIISDSFGLFWSLIEFVVSYVVYLANFIVTFVGFLFGSVPGGV